MARILTQCCEFESSVVFQVITSGGMGKSPYLSAPITVALGRKPLSPGQRMMSSMLSVEDPGDKLSVPIGLALGLMYHSRQVRDSLMSQSRLQNPTKL